MGQATSTSFSSDGINWYSGNQTVFASTQVTNSLTYSNGTFITGDVYGNGGYSTSTNHGINWQARNLPFSGSSIVGLGVGHIPGHTQIVSESIQVAYDPVQNKFVFTSVVYPSITFANAQDAAFWGFDYLQGPSFPFVNGVLTSQWTLTQGGWIQGILPPSLSYYDDSVAHKLIKEARILLGHQVIKRYTGEYLELINDLTIPYENKAILKLMNGTLDFTQAVAAREYYVSLPLGCESIPICALTRQQISVEIDFENYENLSYNLNKGNGFYDPNSYLTYNVSQNLLGGSTFNVATTLSYQQYILILTFSGTVLIYNTAQPIDSPQSYSIFTAFSGATSVFVNFLTFGDTLYIQLQNGYVLQGSIPELIQGNSSSFISNNYLPTSPTDAGSPTGTMVCDTRYVYYAQSNLSQSNVFFVRYDTTTPFQALDGYTSFDFTANVNSNVSSLYQFIYIGSQVLAVPNTPGALYSYTCKTDFTQNWNALPYSLYGNKITEGVLIGSTVYFVIDSYGIITWSNGSFGSVYSTANYNWITGRINSFDGIHWNSTGSALLQGFISIAYGNGLFVGVTLSGYSVQTSSDGVVWSSLYTGPSSSWISVTYGNGLFVVVSFTNFSPPYVMTSPDGINWTAQTAPSGYWRSVTYGNGLFVAVGQAIAPYVMTSPDGITWTAQTAPGGGGQWTSVTYGNGLFVTVNYDGSPHVMTSPDGITWTTQTAPSGYWSSVTYGNGLFVAAGVQVSPYVMTSPDGINWTAQTAPSGYWTSITYGNGLFVAVSYNSSYVMTSPDGINWTASDPTHFYNGFSAAVLFTQWQKPNALPWPTTLGLGGFQNLQAVGTTIYASSSNACVITIDTTKDLATASAYQYYPPNAPISLQPNVPFIFANGPRYVYMFTNDTSQTTAPTNVIRYDPYPITPVLQASIIADYKILPQGVPKPTDATIKYVQNQHVTGQNFSDLQLLGPIKEIILTGTADTANVYQYANVASNISLTITGNEEILTPDVGTNTALQTVAPFQYHTMMPVRNLSVLPFELNPESTEPNGTVNFSRLQYQLLSNGSSAWASSYNILKIGSGIGGLEFNSPY